MALNLNKIKGLFIVPDDETDEISEKEIKKTPPKKEVKYPIDDKTKAQNKTAKTTTNTSSSSTVKLTHKTKSTKGKFNNKVFENLTHAIGKANLQGEDYLELMEALNAMKDLPLSEDIKIQTVLATLSTKGLTLSKIYESSDYYLKILKNEKDKFYEALTINKEGQVVSQQKEIAALEEQIKHKADQIALLTKEMAADNKRIENIRKQISNAESKIKDTEDSFCHTYDIVSKQIIENIEKIKNITTKQ